MIVDFASHPIPVWTKNFTAPDAVIAMLNPPAGAGPFNVTVPLTPGWMGVNVNPSSQPLPVVTLAQVKVAGPVQPDGNDVRFAGVIVNPVAGLESSVVKSTLTGWLTPNKDVI